MNGTKTNEVAEERKEEKGGTGRDKEGEEIAESDPNNEGSSVGKRKRLKGREMERWEEEDARELQLQTDIGERARLETRSKIREKYSESHKQAQRDGGTRGKMLYSQRGGPGSRRSSCVWTEGGGAGVPGGETDNAADLWPLDLHCYRWSNWSQGSDSRSLAYCCGNL